MDHIMVLRKVFRAAARLAPVLRTLIAQRDALLASHVALEAERSELAAELAVARAEIAQRDRARGFVAPGHFYSPIPDFAALEHDAARLFPDPPPRALPGIDLREAEQRCLIERLAAFYAEIPFLPEPQPGLRYAFENGAFSYADAIFLYLQLRDLRPRRIIEIGSGHSSCAILDTADRFLDDQAAITFIEPYPDLLRTLLRPGDEERVTILPVPLQSVPLDTFASLETNDILFVDSTHVGKIGSDVLHLFNVIIPALRPGVRIHFHDVFYPFEYPQYWFAEGRAWNEAYFIRAFLQFNKRFQIELWNHLLLTFHPDFFAKHMPLCLRNPGASLWIRA
jgi:hypothetical protein